MDAGIGLGVADVEAALGEVDVRSKVIVPEGSRGAS